MLRARSIYFKPFIYAAVGCKIKMKAINMNIPVMLHSEKCILTGFSWFPRTVGFYINKEMYAYTHMHVHALHLYMLLNKKKEYLIIHWKFNNPKPQLYFNIKHCWTTEYLKCSNLLGKHFTNCSQLLCTGYFTTNSIISFTSFTDIVHTVITDSSDNNYETVLTSTPSSA